MEDVDMKSSGSSIEIELKYFKLDETYVCAQLSSQMTGAAYSAITETKPDSIEAKKQKRKGRGLFLCLDKSGSMSGTPFMALQEGAKIAGKSVYDNDDFEHFVALFYDS
jgi:uncharacterized protein with von Willebrand factor type A (vWA) domain